jgi:hypothetical protein
MYSCILSISQHRFARAEKSTLDIRQARARLHVQKRNLAANQKLKLQHGNDLRAQIFVILRWTSNSTKVNTIHVEPWNFDHVCFKYQRLMLDHKAVGRFTGVESQVQLLEHLLERRKNSTWPLLGHHLLVDWITKSPRRCTGWCSVIPSSDIFQILLILAATIPARTIIAF